MVWVLAGHFMRKEQHVQRHRGKEMHLGNNNYFSLSWVESSHIGGKTEQNVRKIELVSGMLSCFSHVWLFVTPWTVARQAPLSMGFSRKEYWSGLPCPPPGDLPDSGIEHTSVSPALQVDSLLLSQWGSPLCFLVALVILVRIIYVVAVILCFAFPLVLNSTGTRSWSVSFIALSKIRYSTQQTTDIITS